MRANAKNPTTPFDIMNKGILNKISEIKRDALKFFLAEQKLQNKDSRVPTGSEFNKIFQELKGKNQITQKEEIISKYLGDTGAPTQKIQLETLILELGAKEYGIKLKKYEKKPEKMRKDLKIQEETKEVLQVLNGETSRNEETCQYEEDTKSSETDSLDQKDSATTPESVVSAASSFQTPSNKKLQFARSSQ